MAKESPNIYKIAELAGVSIGTVSRVMNGKDRVSPQTRSRILEIAREHNFVPNAAARGLATKKTHTLMMLVSDIANVYFSEMAKEISRASHASGYKILLGDSDETVEREADLLRTLSDRHVDGAIVAPLTTTANFPHYQDLIRAGFPLVLMDTELAGVKAPCVRVDNVEGATLAVNYLAGEGHRKIAFLCGNINFQTNKLRYDGFCEAMKANSLGLSNEYLVLNQDFLIQEGFCGVEELLDLSDPPTAIFAASDLMAMACIQTVMRRGLRVPDDVAVVGFDDLKISAHMEIPLTTVAQPKNEIAHWAVKLLLQLVNEEGSHADISGVKLVSPRLVVRDSA